MQFSFYAATCLALVSRVFAQTEGFDAISAPTKGQTLTAGSTSTVTWEYKPEYSGTITITLLQGATPETLQLGSAIATGIDNSAGSYTWSVDSTLGADATYGLKISLDSDPSTFQYSFPFHIAASSGAGSSSSSSSSSSSVSVPVSSSASSASVSSTSASSSLVTSLSSSSASTTSAPTTFPTLTPTGASGVNSTSTATGTTLTSKVTATGTGSGTPSSSSSAIATAGAAKVVAGSFAAMGGLAAALFAL